jgi:type IV pilus assembly protein PilB
MSKRIITNLIDYALQKKAQQLIIFFQASNISLDCYLPNGKIHHLVLPKKLEQNFFAILNQILNIKENELITKKYHKILHHNNHLPVYITVLPIKNDRKIIIDLIDRPLKNWSLNKLGFKNEDLKIVKKTLSKRSGLIIIGSPAGQGKSTTLRAISKELNKSNVNLYFLGNTLPKSSSNINVLEPTILNWQKLRQHDSDIVLADDLNYNWTLSEAIITAATGRLVIITLEANNTTQIMKTIKNLELPVSLVKDSLKMIITQRLIPWKHPNLKSTSNKHKLIGRFDVLKL